MDESPRDEAFVALHASLQKEIDRGTKRARHRVHVGEIYGDLTVVEPLGTARDGASLWRLVCRCGWGAARTGRALVRAVREGHYPSCKRCLTEERRGRSYVRARERNERRLAAWGETGSLYTDLDDENMMRGVREDLEAEFGEVEETMRVEDVAYSLANIWTPPNCSFAFEREEMKKQILKKRERQYVAAIRGKKSAIEFLEQETNRDERRRNRA